MVARLARDLPAFLRSPLKAGPAAEIVRRRLETRSRRFLHLAERVIYPYPLSPYARLLRAAGCEPGDLRLLVAREGLDGTLGVLADRGVSVSFDEFKGRHEIVRGSERFAVTEEDFDPPGLAPHLELWTGGTRSAGTRSRFSLACIAAMVPNLALTMHAHGLDSAEYAIWHTASFIRPLHAAKLGRPVVAWFHPLRRLPWQARMLGGYIQTLARLAGVSLPDPTWMDLQHADRLADWLAERTADGRTICLMGFTSSLLRVALAARERGRSLEGVTFFATSEPFTEAKRRAIESVGARAIVHYGAVEAGAFGFGCADRRSADDVHFFSDSYALIQQPHTVGDFGLTVDAFLMTSLQPWPPKVMINVALGDHGVLERRECGCPLGALGLREHLSEIRSHEKLTGEGMTFVRTRLTPIVEEILPGRFGGSGLDYQVIEEEDTVGLLRLYLLASPSLGPLDQDELRGAFLTELGRGGVLQGHMASVWRRAETVQVRRQAPVATRGGKIFPFHLVRAERR
jgi:hypothetical protein